MRTAPARSVAVFGAFLSCFSGCGDDDAPPAPTDGGASDARFDAASADAARPCGDGGPACLPATCTAHADCDDTLFCNGAELCRDGACIAGMPPSLTDGVDCTTDRCDEGTDVVAHDPDNAACDDGAYCNGGESCDRTAGCIGSAPPVLDDGVSCTTDTCDETADVVLHTPSDPACDDGMFCNGAEACAGAAGCTAGAPPVVDDGVACTADRCDEALDAVVHAADDTACNDGDACTGDTCTAGVGCAHPFVCACTTPAECDDGNVCTSEACTAGACVYTNNTLSCDDGSYCNGADTCSAGACTHAGNPCAGGAVCSSTCNEAADDCFATAGTACTDDANPCTNDVCSGAGACTHPTNTAPCGDGLYCNGADVCSGGTCTHPGDPCAGGAQCNDVCNESADSCATPAGVGCASDGNACTNDLCSGTGTCAHPPNTAPCDDGLFCNGTDVCSAGACAHAGNPCAAGAVCNATCNEPADNCFAPAGTACTDDGMACTLDACNGSGTCAHTSAPEATCGNAIDDDCDGMTDCADPDCAADSCGPGGATCVGTTCSCPGGAIESSCTNTIDDDCDGAVDCGDADCSSTVECSCGRTRCMTTCAVPLTCFAGTCGRGGNYAWDRAYGGATADVASSVAKYGSTTYVSGSFNGMVSFGGAVRTSAGSADGYIVAVSDGTYLWDRTYGGTGFDTITGLAVDSSGSVVAVGYVRTTGTLNDATVRLLTSAGTEVWARTYGTDVLPTGVAIDSTGVITVTGYFNGTVDFGGGVRTAGSSPDIFVLSLTSAGVRRWDRTFDGGGSFDAGYAVAADGSGNVYVGGVYGTQVNFGGGLTTMRPGGAFVVSFDREGTWRWDRTFGSTQPDSVTDIEVSQLGDVVIAGSFGAGCDFGGGVRTSSGFVDGVVWVLGTDGTYRWDRVYGNAVDDDRVDGVGVDCAGNVFATGMFEGSVDFGGGLRTGAGNTDVFLLALSRTGAYRWDRVYGSTGADRGLDVAFGSAGSVVGVAGTFSGSLSFGGPLRTSAGSTDGFVLELTD